MEAALGILGLALMGLMGLLGLATLICFILVVVQMFKHEQTGLGITCIVLALCTGIGYFIAFVMGWIKSGEWGLKRTMTTWTGCIALEIVLACGFFVLGAVIGQNANSAFGTVGASIGSIPRSK
jgi:hypothetical protein